MSNVNQLLGYLTFCETLNRDGYLAAILVIDAQGVPQEFRCTHPVKPITIQRPLYGDALEPHIGVNLCGLPLLASLQNMPDVIIIKNEFMMAIRKSTICKCPVLYVRRAGETLEVDSGKSDGSRKERLDSATGKFMPLIISHHPEFSNDPNFARSLMESAFDNFDPLEPFERMTKALEVLAKQDKRFQ